MLVIHHHELTHQIVFENLIFIILIIDGDVVDTPVTRQGSRTADFAREGHGESLWFPPSAQAHTPAAARESAVTSPQDHCELKLNTDVK